MERGLRVSPTIGTFRPASTMRPARYLPRRWFVALFPILAFAGCADPVRDADLQVQLGLAAAQDEQYERAYRLFAEAERLRPGHIPAIVAAGELAIDLGDYSRAEQELSRVISLDPQTILWREKRAAVRQLAGHYDDSLADYNAVIAAQPDNSAALYNRGAVLALRGQNAAAASDLERSFRATR